MYRTHPGMLSCSRGGVRSFLLDQPPAPLRLVHDSLEDGRLRLKPLHLCHLEPPLKVLHLLEQPRLARGKQKGLAQRGPSRRPAGSLTPSPGPPGLAPQPLTDQRIAVCKALSFLSCRTCVLKERKKTDTPREAVREGEVRALEALGMGGDTYAQPRARNRTVIVRHADLACTYMYFSGKQKGKICVSGNFQGKQRVFGAPFWKLASSPEPESGLVWGKI